MEIWNIDLSSDECQYSQGPSAPSKPYTCNHPKNYAGECIKQLCPVASQPAVEADAESRAVCSDCSFEYGTKDCIGCEHNPIRTA